MFATVKGNLYIRVFTQPKVRTMTRLRLSDYLTITEQNTSEFARGLNQQIKRQSKHARFISRQSVDEWLKKGEYAWIEYDFVSDTVQELSLIKTKIIYKADS